MLTLKRIAKALNSPGRYGDGNGLYLQVPEAAKTPRDRRGSWLFIYERYGRERSMGLGPLHTFSLDEARELARKARQQLAQGVDPIDARRAERAAQAIAAAKFITFEAAALQYFNDHEKKWSSAKNREQFLSSLKAYAFPKIGKLPVAAIDTGEVLNVIEPIWHGKTETANRVRGRIEAVLDWATVRAHRSGDNPARWKGHLREVLPGRFSIQKVKHHPALPFGEVPVFLTDLRQREGVVARALEFAILTAARTSEVLGADWSEIDFENATWTIPASRMKAAKEHRVPLSDRAIKMLQALPREEANPHVFIGSKKGTGLSPQVMAVLVGKIRGGITVHGFRSTFRDWAAERTNYPNHILEMALAHAVGSAVERAYRRGDLFDKRRKLMEAWNDYCATTPTGAKVVSLRRAEG